MFARKTQTSTPVALSDLGLAQFVKHHPYIPNVPEPTPEAREADPTFEPTLPPELTAQSKPAKPAKAKKAKRSKRKKRSDPKDDAPVPTLRDPRFFEDDLTDEADSEDADEAYEPDEQP